MNIQTIIDNSIPILKKYGITKAALFGSVVRGEAKEKSDIDMLVQTPKKMSLYKFIDIKLALEERLGQPVDLVDYDAIKPRLKPYILQDERLFFTKNS